VSERPLLEPLRSPWLRLLLLLLALLGLLWCLGKLLPVLTPFVIAFALAYFLNPPVNAMERFFAGDIKRSRLFRGRLDPRAAAVAILCIGVLLVAAIVIAVVVPAAAHQVSDAAAKLPGYLRSLREKLEPLYQRLNLSYPEQAEELRQRVEETIREHSLQAVAPLTHAIGVAFSSLLSFVLSALELLVIPVFAIYLLYDMNRINAGVAELVPHRLRPYVYSRFREVDRLLSAFARGQITVCLMLGAFYALGLTLLSVPMGVLVGFLMGFLHLVPFLSGAVGLPIALLLAWLDGAGLTRLLMVAGVFLVGHFVESNFVTPRIVGHTLGLHAVIVMLAVLVGGTLFGFIGMLVAVPVTAALSVFWADLRAWYLRSDFYGKGASELQP
jgi:predicted PurR-regulated permease PerM